MMSLPPNDARPPVWAESILRLLLPPRNRESVSGDLLEEYRDVVVPTRGVLRAQLWYVRQLVSFVTVTSVGRASIDWMKEDVMFERLWRVTLVCSLLVAAVLLTRFLFDVMDPVDPVERFLAQARDDYSELDYPRRWAPAVSVGAILIGGGLFAAWRTSRITMGTMAAAIASASGSVIYVALVVLVNILSAPSHDSLGDVPAGLRYFGNVPTMLVPILAMLGILLGTVGGVFGRAIHVIRTARSHG